MHDGVADGTTISSGGNVWVYGTANGTTDNGSLVVDGLASGTIVNSGGTESVLFGGIDVGAQISGGTQYDYGSTNGDTIYSGFQIVEAGGIASGTTISSGGKALERREVTAVVPLMCSRPHRLATNWSAHPVRGPAD